MTLTERHVRPWPLTLPLGLALVAALLVLLLYDAAMRGWVVVPDAPLPPPEGAVQALGRFVAQNATSLFWTAYLLLLDGALARDARNGSPVRRRPVRFALCFLSSVPIWLVFDAINFGLLDAWRYHGLPEDLLHRGLSFLLAFGAINPGMFLTAALLLRWAGGDVRGPSVRLGPRAELGLMGLGLLGLVFPLVVRDPVGTLTLWLGWFLLLDPLNRRLGAPSLLADWREGRWGRTLALLAGGLVCGLLWEFWNYWAVAKWTYNLPFLGALEDIRYFEMPLPGLLGFPPFALECWAMFQTTLVVLGRLGLRRIEPLPGPHAVL